MKIKTKKQLNLPQLIEWGFDNAVTNKEYICNEHKAKSVIFNLSGWAEFSDEFSYNPHDTFTVTIEEVVDEDTVIPKVIAVFKHNARLYTDRLFSKSISEILKLDDKVKGSATKTVYVLNNDGTLTLIWRDGKLVE